MLLFILVMVAPVQVLGIDVSLIWSHDKHSGTTTLSVLDTSDQLIAQSCSGVIDGLDFSKIDNDGFGNFSIDGKTYLSHHLPKYSGGPACTKKFNDISAVLDCQGLSWDAPKDPVVETDCHRSERAKRWISHLTARSTRPANEITRVARNGSVAKRDKLCFGGSDIVETTRVVGDGMKYLQPVSVDT